MGVINQQTSLGAKNIFREWDHIYVDAVEVRFFLKWLWSHMFFFSDVLVVIFSSKSREKNTSKSYVVIWLVLWNMIFMTFHILGIVAPTVADSDFSVG
jgi:hypothetical protein